MVLRYTSGGGTDMRYGEGSTHCEQAARRFTVVSVQQDAALDDIDAPVTLPHIPLRWGGHDLPCLSRAENSLRRAWGCGAYSTAPIAKAAAAL